MIQIVFQITVQNIDYSVTMLKKLTKPWGSRKVKHISHYVLKFTLNV